ncbi:hypothetical protein GCM10010300_47970 [Streptomyces olivaceoviridis]|nr:hypothetical protein GCM10010300_47970 [Streptomyces olivaceoviridis]
MRVQNAAHEIRVRAHDGGTRGIARDDVPDQLRQQPEFTAQWKGSGPPFPLGAPFQQKSLWISEVDPPAHVHDTVNFVASRAPERYRTVSGIPD